MSLLATLLAVSTLGASGEVSGVVRSSTGPIAGVEVVALAPGVDWALGPSREQRRAFVRDVRAKAAVLGRARTGKDGRFRLRGLPAGDVALWANAGTRGQALQEQVAGGSVDVTLTLGEAFPLEGEALVRTTENYPYPRPGQKLTVVAVHATRPLLLQGSTDDEGRFSLGHVPAGRYLVVGSGPGVLPLVHEVTVPEPPPPPATSAGKPGPLDLDEPSGPMPPPRRIPPRLGRPESEKPPTGRLQLPFRAAASLAGTVTSAAGPVANARVVVRQAESTTAASTNAKGRFALSDQLAFGDGVGLVVSSGSRERRACVSLYSEVGGTGCCSPDPALTVEAVFSGTSLTCRERVRLDAPGASPNGDSGCPCEAPAEETPSRDAGAPK